MATGTIASNDVDSADSCDRPSTNTSPGTKMIPPPTPRRPLETPAAKPMRTIATSSGADTSEHQYGRRDHEQQREGARHDSHRHPLLDRGARHDAADGRHAAPQPLAGVHAPA